jgi:hypothetical protein
MSTVRTLDGLKYGFKFLGLSLLVLVVGGLFIGGGAALAAGGIDTSTPTQSTLTPAVGGGVVLSLVGVLWVYGASLGLLHKFVADSVATGVDLTESGGGDAEEAAEPEDESEETGAAEASAAEGQPTASSAGVDDSGPVAAASDDTDDTSGQTADTGTADTGSTWDGARDDAATDPDSATSDTGATIDGEPSGEELDRVVSEATEPSADEGGAVAGPSTASDRDPDPVEEDAYGAGATSSTDEPYDDTGTGTDEYRAGAGEPAGYGAEQADSDIERADIYRVEDGPAPDVEADEEAVEDAAFEDIEDTTDEPGDWEPLDEDDL